MENVALDERKSGLFAWNVLVILRIVIKLRPQPDSGFPDQRFANVRNQLEGDRVFRHLLIGKSVKIGRLRLRIKNQSTKIRRTSFGVLPSTLIPLTSMTSSPTEINPDLSAAPPCMTLAIKIRPVPSSAFIVAP